MSYDQVHTETVASCFVEKITADNDLGAKMIRHHYGIDSLSDADFMEYVYFKVFLACCIGRKCGRQSFYKDVRRALSHTFSFSPNFGYNDNQCDLKVSNYEDIAMRENSGIVDIDIAEVRKALGCYLFGTLASYDMTNRIGDIGDIAECKTTFFEEFVRCVYNDLQESLGSSEQNASRGGCLWSIGFVIAGYFVIKMVF